MAMIHGKNGTIHWAGTGTEETTLTSWSVDATADTADGTNMASTGDWREFLGGFKSWTATVEANFNGTSFAGFLATDLGGTAANLELYLNATTFNVYGTAILTGFSVNQDMGDVVKITMNFQGTGALTYSATEV